MYPPGQSRSSTLGLSALFASARQAVGFAQHFAPGIEEPTHIHRKAAAVAGSIRVYDAVAAPSSAQLRRLDAQSSGQPSAGMVQTMHHAIMAASRVVQAGARLIPIDASATPVNTQVAVAWTTRPTRFEVVTAAPFAVVADDAEVVTTGLPIMGAQIDLGEAASHAISFNLSRADQKDRSDSDLEFIVARAIALGVASLCDGVLLKAIVDASPASFSLANAAARGLRFDELRAVCGTSAQGATIGDDGTLRVAGVGAEMTDAVALSVIGAFGRSAVAVEEEIRVTIKRTSLRGDMEITAFVTAEALLPTPDFWVAA